MTDNTLWLRDVFDRRLASCTDAIRLVQRFADTVFNSDIGEGKGTVRERLRRADALMAGAAGPAQKDRYLAQADALRQRALAWDDGYETDLASERKKLLLTLDRLALAWKALTDAQRAELRADYPEWAGDPGTRDWLYGLADVDEQTFIDLGV